MRAITPHPDALTAPVVFTVDGDVAGAETSALAERLWPHLLTAPPDTVLDLGAAGALDDAGVDLLAAAHAYTVHRGLAFSVINTVSGLRRALLAAGVNASAPHTAGPAFASAPLHMTATA